MRARGGLLRRWLSALAITSALCGCSSATREAELPSTSKGGVPCWKPPPTLPKIADSAPSTSRVVLSVVTPQRAVLREVERQVPAVVARGNDVGIGIAGKVDYVVRRGAPTLTLDADSMLLRVPLAISVQVCKPLFGVCPVYGQCNAALDVVTTLPRALDVDGAFEPPRLGYELRRGCILQPIGLDVTPQLRAIASREIAHHQVRVDRETETLRTNAREHLRRAVEKLTQALPTDPRSPMCLLPHTVRYTGVEKEGEALRARIAVDGDIVASPHCETDLDALARIRDDTLEDTSTLYVHERLAFVDWLARINERLAKESTQEAFVLERLAGTTHAGEPVVAAWLTGGGCEPLAVTAGVRLSDAGLSLEKAQGLGSTLPTKWKTRLERESQHSFRAHGDRLHESVQAILRNVEHDVQQSSDGRAQLTWDAGSATVSTVLEAEAVRIVAQVSGRAVLHLD